MNIELRLFIIVVSALVFFFVIRMLVKKNLSESSSVMWFIIGLITLISGIFPDIIARLSFLFGIAYPPALLFLLAIVMLMMIVFNHSINLSKKEAKNNDIASTLSIIKEENKKLKAALHETAASGDSPRKKLLICVPAYNEGENVGALLGDLQALPAREDFDILVVDDGSTDNTRAVCEEKDVAVITHLFNMGYGMALVTGYKYAADNQYDYLIQIDADGQHDVENVERLYKSLTEAGDPMPDIVIGSRFLQDSVNFYIPFYKKIVITFFRFLIKAATGDEITDPSSGLQGLNRNAIAYYTGFNNFAADYTDANMIIQMLLNNFVIREIPAIMHPRLKGESMHYGFFKPFKYVINMTISVMAVWIRESANSKKRKA